MCTTHLYSGIKWLKFVSGRHLAKNRWGGGVPLTMPPPSYLIKFQLLARSKFLAPPRAHSRLRTSSKSLRIPCRGLHTFIERFPRAHSRLHTSFTPPRMFPESVCYLPYIIICCGGRGLWGRELPGGEGNFEFYGIF